jgi:Domain of unknown function (DUF5667)/Domain of unknown function (DUF5666)
MVDEQILEAFEDCLTRLQAGASLQQVLALYPAWEGELRPMLLAAQMARQTGAGLRVPRAAMARSRAKFLQKANQLAAGRSRRAPRPLALRFALASLVVVLVLAAGMATSVAVSAHALPGDVLYPVKIAAEQTRLLLARSPASRLELEETFDKERVAEVDTLIHLASSRDVQFAGGLKAMQGENWLVGNIPVRVTESTRILSTIKPGYYVDVEGRLQPDGIVIAYQVAPRAMQLSGQLTMLTANQWQVEAMSVQIGADTVVQGEPFSGGQVVVQAILLDGGKLQAVSVVVKGAPSAPFKINPSPQPSNTHSAQPSDTAEPTDTRQPSETEIEKPQATREPTKVESPENTPKPTQGEDHPDTPEPTESEDHHETPQPTEDDHHEDQKTPKPTKTPSTPQPTEQEDDHHGSPTPTLSAPAGSPTPTPDQHDD